MSESVLSTISHVLTATREALSRLAPALDGIGSAAMREAGRVEQLADSLAAGPVPAEGLDGVPELCAAALAGRQAEHALRRYSVSLDELATRTQATALALGNVADSLACAPAEAQPESEEQPDPVAQQPDGSLVVLEDRMAAPPDEAADAVGELPPDEDGTAYEAPLGAPAVHANPPADPAPEVPLTPKKTARKRKG